MKKYKDFIFEALNTKDYEELYNGIFQELSTFWEKLEDSIEDFGSFTDSPRDINKVLAFNDVERKKRKGSSTVSSKKPITRKKTVKSATTASTPTAPTTPTTPTITTTPTTPTTTTTEVGEPSKKKVIATVKNKKIANP